MWINEHRTMELNGAAQYVSIRGEQEGAPLLLYLHGGPGDAALPLMLKFNRDLEQHFTVVVWEQRGAGKSYYPFQPEETVTIDIFLQDLHALVEQLLARFHQDKLYLVGHSCGSVLGLRYIQRHPELVRTYVGCGQVVDMKESCRAAYDFVCSKARGKAAAKLARIDPAYTGENWLEDLLFVTRLVVKHGGSLYGKSHYAPLVLPFLFSPHYTPADLIRRLKGSLQSIRRLWPELMETDFRDRRSFEVPVVFVEGQHDRHVSSQLAWDYFESLQTEKQFFWFERSAHFPQWSESGRFHQIMAELASAPQ